MLKIRRIPNGAVTFIVSGRLEADNLNELSALLAAEPIDRPLVLDLKDLLLVDLDSVRFLRTCERDGMTLRHCPPYIRVWIAHDEECDSY
jgi:hypothetical protein